MLAQLPTAWKTSKGRKPGHPEVYSASLQSRSAFSTSARIAPVQLPAAGVQARLAWQSSNYNTGELDPPRGRSSLTLTLVYGLELAPIGGQLFAHNNSQRDCTAFPLF